jgi:hypothetical protein
MHLMISFHKSLFLARCLRRNYQLQDLWTCALAWWCQKYHLTSHTHTLYFLNTLLTSYLYTQPSHSTPSWTRNDLRLLGFVPVYQLALSFPVRFSWWGIENFHIVFPHSLKERVKQGSMICGFVHLQTFKQNNQPDPNEPYIYCFVA